jgi:exopolyphosphatase / guanosine-5'-triphosphate,3'-diphosphate pyrophosphatase
VLETFGLRYLHYSAAGVRDGIIADLAARGVGKERAQLSLDQRREVERLSLRYGVATRHVRKVVEIARGLFHALQPLHQLPLEFGKLLEAAAYLHDTGHFVNDASHHKHSYYLVANSDLPAFTNREREFVANLCRYHRKSLPAPHHDGLKSLSQDEAQALVRLIPLLRVADGLGRGHSQRIPPMECRIESGQVTIRVASPEDIDLELWATERIGEVFRQVYGLPIVVSRVSK